MNGIKYSRIRNLYVKYLKCLYLIDMYNISMNLEMKPVVKQFRMKSQLSQKGNGR